MTALLEKIEREAKQLSREDRERLAADLIAGLDREPLSKVDEAWASRDFWESPTLDELAKAQNVKPMTDVRALFGTWPGEVDDGFEEAIDELRHSHMAGGRLS